MSGLWKGNPDIFYGGELKDLSLQFDVDAAMAQMRDVEERFAENYLVQILRAKGYTVLEPGLATDKIEQVRGVLGAEGVLYRAYPMPGGPPVPVFERRVIRYAEPWKRVVVDE